MKRICALLLSTLFIACSSLDTDPRDASNNEISSLGNYLTRSSSLESGHYIGINQASGIVSAAMDKRIESVETLSKDGLDLFHLATFDDGWALVAADDRLPQQILAFNETGTFNPDSISSPEFAFWYETGDSCAK